MYGMARAGIVMLAVVVLVWSAACAPRLNGAVDDATLTTRVRTALLNDPDVGGRRIDVDAARGIVTLSGTVQSPDEERKAVAIAEGVIGVQEVRSEIQVLPPS